MKHFEITDTEAETSQNKGPWFTSLTQTPPVGLFGRLVS